MGEGVPSLYTTPPLIFLYSFYGISLKSIVKKNNEVQNGLIIDFFYCVRMYSIFHKCYLLNTYTIEPIIITVHHFSLMTHSHNIIKSVPYPPALKVSGESSIAANVLHTVNWQHSN